MGYFSDLDIDEQEHNAHIQDQDPDYSDYAGEDVSDCCGAMIYSDTDICSDCQEHCGIQEWDDDEETPEQMNDRLRSMGF